MNPTSISISIKSRHIFNREVQHEITLGKHFSDIIKKIAPNATLLLQDDLSSSDIDNLVAFLVRKGIPQTDIRLHYASETGITLLNHTLESQALKLDFGGDVAERDNGLERYFIKTNAFHALLSHKKHVVVGPKGSGKSAILKGLKANDPNSLLVTPEHYATEVLESLKKNADSVEIAAYIATWKFTLLVEIFRKLLENRIGDAHTLREIRRYLVDHDQMDTSLSLFERFTRYLRRITQIKGKFGPIEGEANLDTADQLNRLFKVDELLDLIPSLKRALRRTDFTVYLDELDQSWNNTPTANGFLTALLIAAIQLRGYSEHLHVVVFLRSEIFDLLKPHLPQLDKLRSDIETLQWAPRELMNLVVRRALDSLSIQTEIQAESVIKSLFPGFIGQQKISTFDYLISRTSHRPREVIQLCNLALRIAQENRESVIEADSVLRAEEQFSTWKLEYIVSENMYIYPQLDQLLECLRNKSRKVNNTTLDSILADILLSAGQSNPPPGWFHPTMEPSDLMRLLYQLEVIGIERQDTGHNHLGPEWDNYDFVFNRPKAKPEQSDSFLFHPGLWKALELL
jgi:Cdc6-like AAA superfamily ATPase